MIEIDGDVLSDNMVSIFEIARQFRFETLLALYAHDEETKNYRGIDHYLNSMWISDLERRENAVRRHRIGANQSGVHWK